MVLISFVFMSTVSTFLLILDPVQSSVFPLTASLLMPL